MIQPRKKAEFCRAAPQFVIFVFQDVDVLQDYKQIMLGTFYARPPLSHEAPVES